MSAPAKPKVRARRRARRALVQAVYQWQMAGTDVQALIGEFQESGALAKADGAFFEQMLGLTICQSESLDASFASLLDRQLASLDQVERAILRLGACELRHRPDVPWRVVIDEYVALAKTFGSTDSYKYVNGVLDRLAKRLATAQREIGASSRPALPEAP